MFQVDHLESLGPDYSVNISVERKRQLSCIIINGFAKDVAAAVKEVYSILNQAAQTSKEMEHAEILYKQVHIILQYILQFWSNSVHLPENHLLNFVW